jgi:serine protease Do
MSPDFSARRGCRVPFYGLLAAVALWPALLVTAPSAEAQDAIQAAIERAGPTSPEKRAELYRNLANQAEILQQQAAVVKTVAKLVGPTVVHVEADVSPRMTLHYGQGRHVEEAGSGVVVEIGSQQYVLTNRHVVSGAQPNGISITLADGRQIRPLRVWDDRETDVAVMQVSAADLVAALVGDSDRMEIGDFVPSA